MVGFRQLPVLKRLTVSKNRIREVYHRPGFPELYMLTIEDNLLTEWGSFDQLNAFKKVSVLRCGGNPVTEQAGATARNTLIAKLQFLRTLNGSEVEPGERRDAELHYLKRSYEEYVQSRGLQSRVELADEALIKHMNESHPRWYELVEIYGSPLDIVSLKKEGTNIASTSARLKLAGPGGKTLEKKLLLSMTLKDLKAMCGKLFKIEILRVRLSYSIEGSEFYHLDDELRQLSYYSMADGGEVKVENISA